MRTVFICWAVIFFCCSFVTEKNDYIQWSSTTSLTFADFKGKIPPGTSPKSAVNSSIAISYQISQVPGEVPNVVIFNVFDRNTSWIQVKTNEILDLQQINFDYSELYARKIRKGIKEMNQKKITDKQKYIQKISEVAGKLSKIKNNNNILLHDQPHLIKLMKKDISDSLKLYSDFTK